jgi:ribosomal protein S18 acetylase RimI-like enzyme
MELAFTIRPALISDRHHISSLLYFEPYVHRHLDWRMPLDWLGSYYYWVAETNGRVVAALSCTPDPDSIAWVRLFACSDAVRVEDAWRALWQTAQSELAHLPGALAAAIVLQDWFSGLLASSGFIHAQDIIVLDTAPVAEEEDGKPASAGFSIRPMLPADLLAVAEVDSAAFVPLWQNSLPTLERALGVAGISTVAEAGGRVIGYQITTLHNGGGHLARLAVHPDGQRRRVGYALVREMLARAAAQELARVTVNTQSDNHASLAIYRQLGFQLTGERYAVFTWAVP